MNNFPAIMLLQQQQRQRQLEEEDMIRRRNEKFRESDRIHRSDLGTNSRLFVPPGSTNSTARSMAMCSCDPRIYSTEPASYSQYYRADLPNGTTSGGMYRQAKRVADEAPSMRHRFAKLLTWLASRVDGTAVKK